MRAEAATVAYFCPCRVHSNPGPHVTDFLGVPSFPNYQSRWPGRAVTCPWSPRLGPFPPASFRRPGWWSAANTSVPFGFASSSDNNPLRSTVEDLCYLSTQDLPSVCPTPYRPCGFLRFGAYSCNSLITQRPQNLPVPMNWYDYSYRVLSFPGHDMSYQIRFSKFNFRLQWELNLYSTAWGCDNFTTSLSRHTLIEIYKATTICTSTNKNKNYMQE